MPEKYLPIGSIVNVKDLKKKMMIIGYYSLEYQNSVIMYDYVGCAYPEGLLVKNNMFSFNHTDITSVEFVGYEDDTYVVLNRNLNHQLEEEKSDLVQPSSFVNLKFDENGVVIYDEVSNTKKAPEIVERIKQNPFEVKNEKTTVATDIPVVKSAFRFDENGIVIEDDSVLKNKEDIESNFKFTFDDAGRVTGEVNTNASLPADVEESSSNTDSSSDYVYTFDENGIVTGVAFKNTTNNNSAIQELEASAITANELEVTEKMPEYKFDESGFVIEDMKESVQAAAPKQNDDEFKLPHYKFDENGIIIQ